jgi:Pregnancy-associated plasma protein-A/Secretion system C-terminal sorting domain
MMQKLILFLFLFIHTWIFAQNNPCAADLYLKNQIKKDPNYLLLLEKSEQKTAQCIADNKANSRAVITIPIVIHVVYNLNSENISDAQIMSQIKVLNDDFRKKNNWAQTVPIQYQSSAADAEIEFCLAKRDPQGKASTGILRKKTALTNIGAFDDRTGKSKVYHTNQGGDDPWDINRYFNIYVATIGTGILGFAAFPDPNISPADEQGVVIDPIYFGTIGTAANQIGHNLGRTLTHETGHFFNLYHIWGLKDDCNDDDLITDTPIQATSFFGCPGFPQFSCGGVNMFMNYMDYTDDNCMGIFTNGQKARMLACLRNERSGLLSSSGCWTVDTYEPDYQVLISPNPALDFLNITLENEKDATIELTDITGKVLLHQFYNNQKYIDLNIESINNGLYLLKIELDNKWITKKVFISK